MILSDLDNIAYNKFANGEITLAEYLKYQNRDKIMNYEEKYKAALERAKEMCVMPTDKATMEYVFPELAESVDKDERIRRVIIEFLQAQNVLYDKINPEFTMKEAIAWLVKQGQTFTKKDVDDAYLKGVCDAKHEIEKQGEQPTDKIDTKFKVGDWIVNKGQSYLIADIDYEQRRYLFEIGGYTHEQLNWEYIENADNKYHLWTIQDAKDGDVLVNCSNIFIFHFLNDTRLMGYCHVNIDDGRFYDDLGKNECFCLIDAVVNPATKEQRDLLFQKMKEAEYEWDDKKKEPKKTEVTNKESKDEKVRKALVELVKCNERSGYTLLNNVSTASMLAWLEKQEEFVSEDFDDVWETADCDELTAPLEKYSKDTIKKMCHAWYDKGIELERRNWLEKQGEQTHVELSQSEVVKASDQELSDKIEPKFKVGDWCIDNQDGTVFQIVKVLDNTYTYKTNVGKEYSCSHYSLENDARLWTIQDAKDGDVLCYENKNDFKIFIYENGHIHYHCCYSNEYLSPMDSFFVLQKHLLCHIHPATKEQCDLLFAKMKEAGYEWDADKKELKKIEQENEEYNSEDYGIDGLYHAISILEKTLGKVEGYQSDDGILEHKCAITTVKKLYNKRYTAWSEEDKAMLNADKVIEWIHKYWPYNWGNFALQADEAIEKFKKDFDFGL